MSVCWLDFFFADGPRAHSSPPVAGFSLQRPVSAQATPLRSCALGARFGAEKAFPVAPAVVERVSDGVDARARDRSRDRHRSTAPVLHASLPRPVVARGNSGHVARRAKNFARNSFGAGRGRRAPAFRQRLQGQLQHGRRSLAPHRRCGCLFQYSCELRRRQGHRLWTRMSTRLAAALKLKSGWRCQTQCPRVAPRAHRTSTARSQVPAAAGAATVTLHGRAQRASSCTCCLLIAARSTPPADTRRSCPATGRSPGAAPSLRTMRDCTISLWWST